LQGPYVVQENQWTLVELELELWMTGSVVNVNDDDDAVSCHGLFDGPISDLSSPVSFNFSLFLSCHTANILWADEQENFPSLH
jgi:hypothetical protein